jgi:hypothetical protein
VVVDEGQRVREDEIRKDEILHKRPKRERLMNYHALLTSARKEFEDAWASRNNVPATSEHTGQATLLIVKLLASPRANVRQQIIQTLPMLECLINLNDDSILIDTCCVLSHLADGTDDILPVNDDGLRLHLLTLFNNRPSLHLPAFDDKIFAKADIPTQSLVDAKVIWSLLRHMKDSNSKLLEEEVLPILTKILIGPSDDNYLRVACWVLSYISDDIDDIQKILDADVCPHLVKLLRDSSDWVRYPALRTIGNIFTGCTVTNIPPEYGPKIQRVIDTDIMWKLVVSLMEDDNHRLERRLLNFLEILISSTDEDVLRVACMVLSYISVIFEDIIDADVMRLLVGLLGGSSDWVLYPALCIVTNSCAGFSYEVEAMIDAQALPALSDILKEEHCWEYIKLKACIAILNIVSRHNPRRHTEAVIDAGIVARLIRLFENDALADRTRVQAGSAIYFMTVSGGHIDSLVKRGCLEALCKALDHGLSSPCKSIVDICLRSLENILNDGELQKKTGSENDRYAKIMERIEGFEKIEKVKGSIKN